MVFIEEESDVQMIRVIDYACLLVLIWHTKGAYQPHRVEVNIRDVVRWAILRGDLVGVGYLYILENNTLTWWGLVGKIIHIYTFNVFCSVYLGLFRILWYYITTVNYLINILMPELFNCTTINIANIYHYILTKYDSTIWLSNPAYVDRPHLWIHLWIRL